MITTSISWSGVAQRLSGPEGRVGSPEANGHEGSAMHDNKHISQHIIVQNLNYAITIIRHIGTIQYTGRIHMSTIYMYTPTLVQTQHTSYNYMSTIQLQFHRYTYTIHVI